MQNMDHRTTAPAAAPIGHPTNENDAPDAEQIAFSDNEEIATGETFAEARELLKKAKHIYVAVVHYGCDLDWSYARIARKEANTFLIGYGTKDGGALRSRLVRMTGELNLFLGSPYGPRENV